MKIFVLGYPDVIGGASVELGHTVRVWRHFGLDVHLIPTWGTPPKDIIDMMDECGAITHIVNKKNEIASIPGLEGSVVSSFCNSNLFNVYPVLKKLDCRVVYSNCMTWQGDKELECAKDHGLFAAYHWQSEYQRDMLEPRLKPFGFQPEDGYLIRGAFDTRDFDFNPTQHKRQTPFVFGKLGRCDCDKWPENYFKVFKTILYREKKLLMMGYSELAHRKLGTIPKNSEWLKPCAMPVKEYYSKIHCLWTWNGSAGENWPRIGLEAMAIGVPVVAENKFGWTEMIDHGMTGFLGDDDEAMAFYASLMAHDEVLRMKVVRQARERLEAVLARPDAIWAGWKNIFTKLGA